MSKLIGSDLILYKILTSGNVHSFEMFICALLEEAAIEVISCVKQVSSFPLNAVAGAAVLFSCLLRQTQDIRG